MTDLERLVAFGRTLVAPRHPDIIAFEREADARAAAVECLKSANLHAWVKPAGRPVNTFCKLNMRVDMLGIFPLHVGGPGKPRTNLELSNLTALYCHDVRAHSRVRQSMSLAAQFAKYLPKYAAAALSSYPKYCGGKSLMDEPEVTWEAELYYQIDRFPRPCLFPAFAAAAFYNGFGAASILDFCAGWGDRLLAACSCDRVYVGIDPSTQMQPVYDRIIKAHGTAEKQSVLCAPFETLQAADLLAVLAKTFPPERGNEVRQNDGGNEAKFDMCLTSPPFFDYEIYCDEDTQSIKRFPRAEDWIQNFLFKSLATVHAAVKSKGLVVLHIADTKGCPFVHQTIDYCRGTLGWRLAGYYAMNKCHEDQGFTLDNRGTHIHGKPLWVFHTP